VQQMVLAGNTAVGGLSRWDIRGSGSTLDMGGFTLTKTGTNQVAFVGSTVNNPGNIIVAQGVFSLHLATALNGDASNTLTLQSGAALNFYQSPFPQMWTLVLNNGSSYWSSVGGPGQNDWSGPVSVNGNVTLLADAPCQFFGDLTGPGGIIKTGAATTTLSGSNSYAGNTAVNQGRLVIQQATLATNSTLTVATNAVLEMNFVETNTVAALVLGGVSKPAGVYSSTTDPTYLAGTGSLLVVPGIPSNPTLSFTSTGSSLQFTWTGNFKLQAQTNSLSVGISNNWVDYPGGGSSPVTVTVDPAQGSVSFRLSTP
jgi:fibronectin-binding autotransporter adhesin